MCFMVRTLSWLLHWFSVDFCKMDVGPTLGRKNRFHDFSFPNPKYLIEPKLQPLYQEIVKPISWYNTGPTSILQKSSSNTTTAPPMATAPCHSRADPALLETDCSHGMRRDYRRIVSAGASRREPGPNEKAPFPDGFSRFFFLTSVRCRTKILWWMGFLLALLLGGLKMPLPREQGRDSGRRV